ncbi:hypothetical protein GCM10019016_039000 [Streptomyces prasinosporus]|uniref:Uncharacterized protein n=1 Tax=Streptomyces prasinosporus TaxID=68256 RepID=A0ABP6TNC6_9ACTN
MLLTPPGRASRRRAAQSPTLHDGTPRSRAFRGRAAPAGPRPARRRRAAAALLASAVAGRDLTGCPHPWLHGATTPPMPGHPERTSAARAATPATGRTSPRTGRMRPRTDPDGGRE